MTLIRSLALCLAALAVAPAAGADPVTYDTAKAKALADRDRAWLADGVRAAYRAGGHTSPKWDLDAEAALRAAAELPVAPALSVAAVQARYFAALDGAIEAGCDDPLIRQLHGSTLTGDKAVNPIDGALALGASKYPPVWKITAYLDALVANRKDDDDVRAALVDKIVAELGRLAADTSPTARRYLAALCEQLHEAGAPVGQRKAWFDRADAAVLAKLPKTDPTRELATGVFLCRYAWDARGTGVAATVTAEGWRLLKERLGEAEKHLKAAWDLDPKCGAAAAEMVIVCTGLGRDRAEMETWFRRAVETEQARNKVFRCKLNYVQAKWHGSDAEEQAFLREMAALGAWDSEVPLLVLGRVIELAPPPGMERREHFEQAWKDFGPVLEGIRKHHPKSPLGASVYMQFAWEAEQNATEAWEYVQAQSVPVAGGFFTDSIKFTLARMWVEENATKKN